MGLAVRYIAIGRRFLLFRIQTKNRPSLSYKTLGTVCCLFKIFSCTLPVRRSLVAAIPIITGFRFHRFRCLLRYAHQHTLRPFVGRSVLFLPAAHSAQCIPASRSDWKEKCSVTIGPTPFCTNSQRIRSLFQMISLGLSPLLFI